MHHEVSGDGVVPRFGSSPAREHGFGDSHVPDEVVGVHRRVGVAPAAVHGQVGAHLHVPGQGDGGADAILEVDGVDGREPGPFADGVVPVGRGLGREVKPLVEVSSGQ